MIELPADFIEYLLEDGVVLPDELAPTQVCIDYYI